MEKIPRAQSGNDSSGDDLPVVAPVSIPHPHQEQKTNSGRGYENKSNPAKNDAKKSYWQRLLEEGPDRHIELVLALVIAFFAAGQWFTSCNNNSSTSRQTERLLQSANRIDDAADSFSKSSSDMSRSFDDAVAKLAEQTKASRDFATLTKKQFTQDQRPYLWQYDTPASDHDHDTHLHIESPDADPLVAQKLEVLVWIKNFGKSPALNVHSYGYVSVKSPHPEGDTNWKGFSDKDVGGIYPPGGEFSISARTADKVPLDFLATHHNPYTTLLAIHVLITYSDQSGGNYKSLICIAVQGNAVGKRCNQNAK